MRGWIAGVGALGVLAGCHASDTPSAPATPASTATVSPVARSTATVSAPAPVASAPTEPASPCGNLLEENRKALSIDPEARPGQQVDLSRACYPTPGGAWGLRLASWQREGDESFPTFVGNLTAVRFRAGSEARWAPGITIRTNLDYSDVLPPQLADIDGDGEPELFLAVDQKIHEGPGYRQAFLLTARGNAVTTVAGLPDALEEMKDVNGDGHMDFLYNPYREERESACSGFGYQWQGPALLAHGMGGGKFSLDDAVAVGFLKKSCPAPPKKARPRPTQGFQTAMDGAPPELCARLWGKSEKEAAALLNGECKAPKNGEDACQAPAGVCSDYADREKTMKKAPVLLLK